MTRSPLLSATLCALLLPVLSSCDLIDVTDSENSNSGRGAKVFDPYQAAASGAIKLSLQMLNGCAFTPSGGMVAKNSLNIPYPAVCANLDRTTPFSPSTGPFDPDLLPPAGKLTLLANTTYFLNQLSITDTVVDKHKNTQDFSEFIKWLKTETHFRNLDWGNLGQVDDAWVYVEGFPGAFLDAWNRVVQFDNANWQRVKDDTFLVEVLDAGGTVRTSQTYLHSEFLVETPYAGHTQMAWHLENVAPPLSPEDTAVHPVQTPSGNLPQDPLYRSLARLDMVGSTNPFKTFQVGDLQGDGALRVTWSLLPNEPFYFPVTFQAKADLPVTCSDDAGNPKACGFGLAPGLSMVAPANGKFYVAGETLNMFYEYRDEEGNRLHSPDFLPSSQEIFSDNANGLLALMPATNGGTGEADAGPLVVVSGPLQNMSTHSDLRAPKKFLSPDYPYSLIAEGSTLHVLPTTFQVHPPTRVTYKLPADATPGTYVVYIKGTRYFMGERVSRNKPFFFQVGQEQLTTYPGKVGNCQICHRGVLSLDNLRHGLSVDHIEGCKACHSYASDAVGRIPDMIHKIHMRSKKYPLAKNECAICHLTRESATRPSVTLCKACHPSTHDNQYFNVEFTPAGQTTRFGNCAQACHGEQTPKSHILPAN